MTDNTDNSDSSEPLIDPDVQEELENIPGEDPFLTEYASGNGDESDSINFISEWFPDSNEWQGKTEITPKQARALSLFRALPHAYDELSDMEPFIVNLLDNYEKYLTSIDGKAREQQAGILKALVGGESEMTEDERSAMMSMFANPDKDNE